jgi:predicted amidohydrolase YtcJ
MVAPGSLAEKGGLKTGDLILSINRRSAKDLTAGELQELRHLGMVAEGVELPADRHVNPELLAEVPLYSHHLAQRVGSAGTQEKAVMEVLQKKYPRSDPRNRDIHCTVVNPELIARIKKLGILPTIFGPYAYYHGDKLLLAFGEKRAEWMFAARSFLDAGVKVAAHSDFGAGPMPPLMGIHALVNRVTKAGKPIGSSQRVSVMEALRLYTINSAYQSFDEDNLGSIEEGKFADFVILGRDILTVPTEEIKDIPIDATIVGGKTVYERK